MEVLSTKTVADRLALAMKVRGYRQTDVVKFAERYCARRKYAGTLSKSDLSQYLSGKVEPSDWKLAILAVILDVNFDWLKGDDVPMEPVTLVAVTGEIPMDLSDEEKILVAKYREATEERRRIVMQILSNE